MSRGRKGSGSPPRPFASADVSVAQLSATLRGLAEACASLGEARRWQPIADSEAGRRWRQAVSDSLALTLAEADAHAILLLRSGLEHAVAMAQSMRAGRTVVPLTLGRTAAEHLLRAEYAVEPEAAERERAGRRLNEWLYAVGESERLRQGVVKAKHPGAEALPDHSGQLAKIEERSRELGFTLHLKGGWPTRVNEVEGRPGPMKLSERYVSNEGAAGVTAAVFRSKSAAMHGTETGLLSAAEEAPTSFPVQSLQPRQMPVGQLAFTLMTVPLSAFNATRAVATEFGWRAETDEAWAAATKAMEGVLKTWGKAIESDLDEVAPDRPRTGLFGPLS